MYFTTIAATAAVGTTTVTTDSVERVAPSISLREAVIGREKEIRERERNYTEQTRLSNTLASD